MLSVLLDAKLSDGELMRALFEWVDARCAEISVRAVCCPSCAHCCRGPLDITQAEANLIAETVGSGFTGNAQAAASPFSTPCPLLDPESKQCTAYEVRPLACRTRFAFDDPALCAKGAIHDTYNMVHFIEHHGPDMEVPAVDGAIRSLYSGFRADVRFFFG